MGSSEIGPSRDRVVVVHQGALGDFLLALPAVEGLSRLRPAMRVDFVSKKECFDLIASKPYAGSHIPPDGPALAPFFHDELWLDARVPAFLQNAEDVFILGQAGSRLLASRLSRRLECAVHWIQSFPDPDGLRSSQPVSLFVSDQLRRLGFPIEDAPLQIEASLEERAEAGQWLKRNGADAVRGPVLIHPGSGGRKKIWPLDRWWDLVHWLKKVRKRPVVLALGPADGHLSGFARAVEAQGAAILDGAALARLVAILAQSRAYVGNDSGVSHLAAAVGVPSVVLFGPTDPRVWAPRGHEVHVVPLRWEDHESLQWTPRCLPDPPDPEVRSRLELILSNEMKRSEP